MHASLGVYRSTLTALFGLCLLYSPTDSVVGAVGFVSTERILKGSKSERDIESANRAIRSIAEEMSVHFVFQTAVYASPRIDITDRVISRLNGRTVRTDQLPSSIRFAFVSTERVLRESSIAKASQSRLEKEFSKQESEIADLSSRLRIASDRLERDSTVISSADRIRRQREVADIERDLQQRSSDFKAELNRRRNEELTKVIEVANRAIRLIAESNGVDIIFQEAVYASSASDITNAVITQMESPRTMPAERGVIFSTRTVKFVSTDRVLRESEPAVSAKRRLEAEFKARESALASKGNTARDDDERRKFREDLNTRRNQELATVVELANNEIRRIAEKDSIDFVFQEAVFASSSVDFSQPIVSALNTSHHSTERKSLSGVRVAEGKNDTQSHNPRSSDKSMGTDGRKGAVTKQTYGPPEHLPGRVELSLVSSVSNPDAAGVVVIDLTSNGDIVSLTVDGVEEMPRTKGRYSVRRFARVGENRFEVVATDRFGNTKTQVVSVVREPADTTVRFSTLNPAALRGKPANNAVAIIIGIQDYRRVPKAEFANNDARVFYDYAIRGLGVRPENVKLLVDQQADDVEILGAFKNWLPLKAKRGQTDVYVFYSGHGLPSDDGASLYFLPHGVDRQFLDRTAIKQAEIVSALQAVSPKSVTLFLDACYSGQSRGGETLLASARPIAIQPKASTFPSNFTVLSASAPEQIASSSPDLKHGIFSYFLMKGMEGEADQNKDGAITVQEMQAYLSDSVGRKAMSINRTQQPQLAGDQSRVLIQR